MPVDAYGVGASLFDGRFDFTADIVQLNGKPEAKWPDGRSRTNPRMERCEVDARREDGDGAGLAKMKTLDEAMILLQRIHGLVEMYAVAVKNRQPSGAAHHERSAHASVAIRESERPVWIDRRPSHAGEPWRRRAVRAKPSGFARFAKAWRKSSRR